MSNTVIWSSAAEACAALDHATAQIQAGEVAQVLAIAALCDLHQVDEDALFEGAERWVRGGADGTPLIGEFLSGEVAGILGVSIGSAVNKIAQVLNVRHRHPSLWQAVCAGEIRFWQAASVADECVTAHLDAAACLRVDASCAAALRIQPWQRVRTQIPRWILLADPQAAAERARQAAEMRNLRVGEFVDGHCEIWGRLDAADGVDFDQALDSIADTLPADLPRDHRRAAAVGVLARRAFGQEELPRAATLVVHADASDLADPASGVADVEGFGAILMERLGSVLAGCRVTVRPVVHTDMDAATDAYEVPPTMRFALEQRNPVDVFPFGTRSSRRCDADHTVPFEDGVPGQTRLNNLGPLSRFTHRLKTHGGWTLNQPRPGVFEWRSPLGYRYRVTPTGTVRVEGPRAAPVKGSRHGQPNVGGSSRPGAPPEDGARIRPHAVRSPGAVEATFIEQLVRIDMGGRAA